MSRQSTTIFALLALFPFPLLLPHVRRPSASRHIIAVYHPKVSLRTGRGFLLALPCRKRGSTPSLRVHSWYGTCLPLPALRTLLVCLSTLPTRPPLLSVLYYCSSTRSTKRRFGFHLPSTTDTRRLSFSETIPNPLSRSYFLALWLCAPRHSRSALPYPCRCIAPSPDEHSRLLLQYMSSDLVTKQFDDSSD